MGHGILKPLRSTIRIRKSFNGAVPLGHGIRRDQDE